MTDAVILIPARYASNRYPGKPLAELRGVTGKAKSLIRRTWDAAQQVSGVRDVFVTTEDARIRDHVEAFGGKVLMTSDLCRNGTERCGEALAQIAPTAEVIVNLQGDAPLTPPWFIEALIERLSGDPSVMMATPVLRLDLAGFEGFQNDRAAGRVGGTTAVFDHAGRALFFSKEVIPYTGRTYGPEEEIPVFHHVGVYAYRPGALDAYKTWEPGPLEELEGLEQLRFLENGMPVACVEVDARGREFWELNNPIDVGRIERMLADQGLS